MKLKKILAVILSLVILLGTLPLCTITVSAATEGIWQYYISGSSACVTGVTQKQSGKVYIPSTLGGYPVTAIGSDWEQFGNLRGCHVVIPQGVTSINSRCFQYCSPASITIPKSLTWVSFCAFNYCWDLTDVYYEGSSSDRSNIRIEYVGIGGNDAFVDATWHYNTPYVYSILDLILENNEITEEDYIKLHVSFSKWFKENDFKTNHSFSDVIWSDEIKNQESCWWNQLTQYKTWDLLGDIGKVASLDFGDLKVNADYYKLFLSDFILALNSSEISTKIELKSFELYKNIYGKVEKAFQTTDEWNENISSSIDRELEIKGIFINPEYKMSDGMASSIANMISEIFVEEKNLDTIINIFQGLDIVDQVCDYVSGATDLAEAYLKAQKAYIVAKCYKEVNQEFFEVLRRAAEKMENKSYAEWFLEALEYYERMSMSDPELYEKAMTVIELADFTYDTVCKKVLSEVSYLALSKILGCAPSAIGINTFAYNTYYSLLDCVLGVSEKSVPYYFMNYISPIEKALCLVEEDYANTLQSNQTYENALKYDYVYSLLKNINAYLYQCAYDYSEKGNHSNDMNYVSLFSDTWKVVNCHILSAKIVDGGKIQSTGSLNSNYTYNSCCGENEISKYSGLDSSLIIPSKTLDNKNVTTISYDTFSGNKNITNLMISEGITRIESRAFKNCSNIERIVIPKTVTYISDTAFIGCNNLKYIEVADGNNKFIDINNCLIDSQNKTLVLASQYASIPTDGSVTVIGNYAFANRTNLTQISMPESITKIGNYAFSDCSNLRNITLFNNITQIGSYAFYNCINLQNIVIPNSVTKIGNNAFNTCESITKITIPDSVTSVNVSAFYNCKSLKEITLGNKVSNIGYDLWGDMGIIMGDDELEYSFTGCDNLENVFVNDGNTQYSSLNGLLCDKNATKLIVYPQGRKETIYTIPECINAIGNYAFYKNNQIVCLTFNDNITEIGKYAFEECINLKTIYMTKNIDKLGIYAFNNCNSLETVYYYGTEEEWQKISSVNGNSSLTNADIIFACKCGSSDFYDWVTVKEQTCLFEGILQRICKKCGETQEKTILRTPHTILDGVCNLCGNEIKIVESSHPYANNANISTPVTINGAIQMLVTFSSDTILENNYDKVYIYDANGTQVGMYTGTTLASKTIVVNGNTVTIRLTSDGSVTKYGYRAEITPIYPQIGDTNIDGEINTLDLTNLRIALLSNDTDYTDNIACDANGDGKIDIRDLVHLKKKLAEIID